MIAWLLLPGLPMPGARCRLIPAESQPSRRDPSVKTIRVGER